MRYLLVLIFSVFYLIQFCTADDGTDLSDETARINYSVGYQIGGDFKKQGVEINPELLVKGIQDVLEGNATRMTSEEMNRALADLNNRIVSRLKEQQKKAAEDNLASGRAFLEKNRRGEGVQALPSGLQYKVIREGNGAMPSSTDTVTVHYRGSLIDGTEFENSYQRGEPSAIQVNRVISGWKEALMMMKEGSKWQLFVPPELAYGERTSGRIASNSTLIFEVELISIEKDSGGSKVKQSGSPR